MGCSPSPSLRQAVELGNCHICDYCLEQNGTMVLLEDTKLDKSIKNYRDLYVELPAEKRGALIRRLVRDEQLLKLYGSFLALERLADRCDDAKALMMEKHCVAWFIVPDEVKSDDIRMLDPFFGEIKGLLRAISAVKILRLSALQKKLNPNTPTNNRERSTLPPPPATPPTSTDSKR